MKSICKELQDMLAAEGPQAVRENEGAQRHLEECATCFSFLETLSELNENLRELPVVDAPEALVEKLLARPELSGNAEVDVTPAQRGRFYSFGRLRWAVAAAAVVVAGLTFLITPSLYRARPSFYRDPEIAELRTEGTIDEVKGLGYTGAASVRKGGRRDAEVDAFEEEAPARLTSPRPPVEMHRQNREPSSSIATPAPKPSDPNAVFESSDEGREVFPDRDSAAAGVAGAFVDLPDEQLPSYYRGGFDNAPSKDSVDSRNEIVTVTGESSLAESIGKEDRRKRADQSAQGDDLFAFSVAVPQEAARAFLAERASLDGLTFKEAKGYWANTYLPGDPAMRFLEARLRQYDPSALAAYTTTRLRLHDAARPTPQPFDSPGNAAIAVYLHADRQGLPEEGCFLVQVGLKAIERQAGRRPAMNVGVVLDLRGEIPVDIAASMRALLLALNEAKELGDRFHLVIAGRPGGLVLEPDDFRHGTLAVTWNRFFGPAESVAPFDDATLSLVGAAAKAIKSVNQDDDPIAVLGSSLVLLVTSQPLGDPTGTLSDLAHQSAVAGIPLSVVGVGGNVVPKELERITLAGQGRGCPGRC